MIKNIAFIGALVLSQVAVAQTSAGLWHGKERAIHYRPDGEDFVLVNGKKRFNRALYGTNTAFRVEAGDLPEFALYMPGMGGNLKFGLISGNFSKWIIDAETVESRYRPGSMLYTIKDPLLGKGVLKLNVLALAEGEGIIVKTTFEGDKKDVQLLCAFGGATGKKFSRDGDIGADPESSFYLKPEYCADNIFQLFKSTFNLFYGKGKILSEEERYEIQHFPNKAKEQGIVEKKQLTGIFPMNAKLTIGDAAQLKSPLSLAQSSQSNQPVLNATIALSPGKDLFFSIQNPKERKAKDYQALASVYNSAEVARQTLAGRIKVKTPDNFINTLGGALSVAADGIWENPSYLHGAVAWRMRLNAWRGAYVADALGWHDRAKLHFSSYAKSQVLNPEQGPVVMDTVLHLARHQEKMGTSVFSNGYISRNPNDNSKPHHYDMNLVFFDQMLTHFYYTGDISFIKEMWPVIKRHLAWEKRNFDNDGDGLYDAYAAIWASDALQYSGGGVTHSSAYNYRSHKIAAQLAKLLGEDSAPYQQEADKILKAIQFSLWMPHLGWYAEYKDLLGLKLLHPSAGLWTIYHAIDSDVPNPFQAYQALRFIDTQIPHIPIVANGLPDKKYYTLSTTNWQPYEWSLNNVALAEVLHTALAYWQGARPEEAYKLWESIMVESMYLSSSPGGFEQLSYYDAIRGELYRDFADPIAMAARSLMEGMYGIKPDALADTLTIKPGFPSAWKYASLRTPDITFDFKRGANADTYQIAQSYGKQMNLKLQLRAVKDKIKSVTVNGQRANWKPASNSVDAPVIEVLVAKASKYEISIAWEGNDLPNFATQKAVHQAALNADLGKATALEVYDPQDALENERIADAKPSAIIKATEGDKTIFLKLQQGDFTWWQPIDFKVLKAVEIIADQEQTGEGITLTLKNNAGAFNGKLTLNKGKQAFSRDVKLEPNAELNVQIPAAFVSSGTNLIRLEYGKQAIEHKVINWSVKPAGDAKWQKVDLTASFNDAVTNIFKNKYLSPRPKGPTLQLPWQGIGNWCYPLTDANIDDSGLRKAAAGSNEIRLPNGVPIASPASSKNIVFTSQWDNYPDSVNIPLKGKSSHAYLLMAGSTNPMQTRIDNGEVLIYYKDGTFERLALRNPETWWPIEQDYFTDGFAFTTDYPKPYRLYLKTGEITRNFKSFSSIKGYSNFAIDGGAATVLDLPLNPQKELKELRLRALANDVVIGLMGVTLQR